MLALTSTHYADLYAIVRLPFGILLLCHGLYLDEKILV